MRPVLAADDLDAVRFAVIGVDHPHAAVLAAGLLDAGATCVGWADPSGSAGHGRAGVFPGLFPALPERTSEELLASGLDLAVLAPIPNQRAKIAIGALDAGVDVLVAKPGATCTDDLDAVEAAAVASGKRWWVAFTEHFTSRAVVRADEIIASGRIGTVRHVLGIGPHRVGPNRPDWFFDPGRAGALIVDLASHQLHHAARLLGTSDLTVLAARTTSAAARSEPWPGGVMLGEVLVEGGTGSAYLRVDWLTPDGLPSWGDVRLFVTGDVGTIEVRSNCDPGGSPGGDHLVVVDAHGVERMDCSADPLGWAHALLADVRDDTETLTTTEHSIAVSRLALRAAAAATG